MSSDKKPATKKEQQDLLQALYGMQLQESKDKQHKFWNTQPVLQYDEKAEEVGPIEVKTVEQVSAQPYALPSSFVWSDCNLDDQKELDEVYQLLSENYVEDDDNMFRFDYSREFLKWALQPPGYLPQLHVGVRTSAGKLVGFITGIPAKIRVYEKVVDMVEINFLCVHKKLRSKRLAPVLIKEITRRVNRTNVWQAVYTAGVVLPKPVSRNRYFHRSLNPNKLIDIGFSQLPVNKTRAMMVKKHALPNQPKTAGFRVMTAADVPQAHQLLSDYLKSFKLGQVFSQEEFHHLLLPRDGVVNSFVVARPDGKITDFVSFYTLPSHVIKHPKHKTLKAAYSYYNVSTATPWTQLMSDALIAAKQLDFDVFNALNVMENSKFFEELKFGPGDGHLQYYVYNFRCPEMQPQDMGLVLL